MIATTIMSSTSVKPALLAVVRCWIYPHRRPFTVVQCVFSHLDSWNIGLAQAFLKLPSETCAPQSPPSFKNTPITLPSGHGHTMNIKMSHGLLCHETVNDSPAAFVFPPQPRH